MMRSLFIAFVVVAVSGFTETAAYSRTASLSGQSFLDAFSWQAIPDPTHGRVNYVDQATAQSAGLYSVVDNVVTLRADNTTVVDPNGPGRNSFRLMSTNSYSTHVAIFDISHVPQGCGTWPAVFGSDWPNNGEIDILEGVDDRIPNQSTLHTSANCFMPSYRAMTGTSVGLDCDVATTNNAGCGVQFADPNSFGPNFNGINGGWYAVERTPDHVSMYFWPRNGNSIPDDVRNPTDSVDTSAWGTPAAYFPNTDCDFTSHLGPMNIIIDLTLCGDWAGAGTYCLVGNTPWSCVDFVNWIPGGFSAAYFEFNSLNIYE